MLLTALICCKDVGGPRACALQLSFMHACVHVLFTSVCQREGAVYSLRETSRLFGASLCLASVMKEKERREESESRRRRRRRLDKVEICTRKRKSMQNSC